MHSFELIEILAFGLLAALVLGFLSNKLKLSPFIGYLAAGFIIGPHFPGYTADYKIASQLAEAGVILLMFGVGLHFDLKDLSSVRKIALPGAILQTVIATAFGIMISSLFGYSFVAGAVLGMGFAVASTVVLIRLLEDNRVLETTQGHIAVGWLIVEDILTVLALVILPTFAGASSGNGDFFATVAIAIAKVALFGVVTLIAGYKLMPVILGYIAKSRSRELFTLTILVTAFLIATIAATIFGVSFALGAFLAGMVVGNTNVSNQATSDILPMKDAFSVLFFISVGMLFDPVFIFDNIGFVLACISIILIIKPLTAISIVLIFGYSFRTALTVAVGLAQIGEFSFILAQQAEILNLISKDGYSVLIACALISIAINPLLFKWSIPLESFLRKRERLWNFINIRNYQKNRDTIIDSSNLVEQSKPDSIIVGFGPVGKRVYELLRDKGLNPVIIELNIETIKELTAKGIPAIYGNGSAKDVMKQARAGESEFLFITLPEIKDTIDVISCATSLNHKIKIIARTRYSNSSEILKNMGVHVVSVEEEAVSDRMIEKIGNILS